MYVHYYAIKLLYYYVNCTPVIMSLYQLISFSYQCIYVLYIIHDYAIYVNQMLYPYVYIVDLDLNCLPIEIVILNKILVSLNPCILGCLWMSTGSHDHVHEPHC